MRSVLTGMTVFLALNIFGLFEVKANAGEKEINLMRACKKECPHAKNNQEAMGCTEVLEHGPDAANFKKSSCFAAHHAFESALVKAAQEKMALEDKESGKLPVHQLEIEKTVK